jgi:DNA repair exonuclease SbcCD ATPase subunit
LKIIQLTAENVKKLVAVQINPDGNMVQITGKNGQGKTSVLDSIWWALAGSETIQAQPIRKGADKARIELKLGAGQKVELVVERRFTDKASYLEVKTADGAKYPSPQKMLDDLLGALTFDPLDFMRRNGREQFDVLKRLVPLTVDLDAHANADKADFARRTELNRDAKAKRAAALVVQVPENLPPDKVDESALLDKLQSGADHNAGIEREKAIRQELTRNIENHKNVAANHLAKAAEMHAASLAEKDKAVGANDKAKTLEKELKARVPSPEPIDLSAVRSELEQAQQTNAKITSRNRKTEIEQEAIALEQKAEAITKTLEQRAAERLEAFKAATMPVSGLSFGDGVVTFNDLPLEQASDAEQLTVSTSIAAALNPKLRIVRIRDGSLLDEDAMKRLACWADERDMQVWIERVDNSGAVGIVMEEGRVKS